MPPKKQKKKRSALEQAAAPLQHPFLAPGGFLGALVVRSLLNRDDKPAAPRRNYFNIEPEGAPVDTGPPVPRWDAEGRLIVPFGLGPRASGQYFRKADESTGGGPLDIESLVAAIAGPPPPALPPPDVAAVTAPYDAAQATTAQMSEGARRAIVEADAALRQQLAALQSDFASQTAAVRAQQQEALGAVEAQRQAALAPVLADLSAHGANAAGVSQEAALQAEQARQLATGQDAYAQRLDQLMAASATDRQAGAAQLQAGALGQLSGNTAAAYADLAARRADAMSGAQQQAGAVALQQHELDSDYSRRQAEALALVSEAFGGATRGAEARANLGLRGDPFGVVVQSILADIDAGDESLESAVVSLDNPNVRKQIKAELGLSTDKEYEAAKRQIIATLKNAADERPAQASKGLSLDELRRRYGR